MNADADSRIATTARPRDTATKPGTPAGHRAAREGAALFERPGSTLVEVTGSERLPYLNSLCTNKLIDLEPDEKSGGVIIKSFNPDY